MTIPIIMFQSWTSTPSDSFAFEVREGIVNLVGEMDHVGDSRRGVDLGDGNWSNVGLVLPENWHPPSNSDSVLCSMLSCITACTVLTGQG